MDTLRPSISVIIPTYQRARQLSLCLSALAGQDYPQNCFEVLVVDDGSPCSPEDNIEQFHGQLTIRLLKQLHSGPAAARNYGAAHAKGSFLAFIDDDCVPAPEWLQSLADGFVLFPDCVQGGRTVNQLTNNIYSATSQLVVDYLHASWNRDPDHATFFTSNNLALPAKCFQAIGGFDATWRRAAGEDRELCDRLIVCGYRLIYAPDALVYHAHHLAFGTFWQQHSNYGRGAYRLYQLRGRQEARSIGIEPLGFYLKMLGYPFFRTQFRRAALMAALVIVAQTANAAGFWREWLNK